MRQLYTTRVNVIFLIFVLLKSCCDLRMGIPTWFLVRGHIVIHFFPFWGRSYILCGGTIPCKLYLDMDYFDILIIILIDRPPCPEGVHILGRWCSTPCIVAKETLDSVPIWLSCFFLSVAVFPASGVFCHNPPPSPLAERLDPPTQPFPAWLFSPLPLLPLWLHSPPRLPATISDS